MLFSSRVKELSNLNFINVLINKITFYIYYSFYIYIANKLIIAFVFFKKIRNICPFKNSDYLAFYYLSLDTSKNALNNKERSLYI
jgi:hypothetical protein